VGRAGIEPSEMGISSSKMGEFTTQKKRIKALKIVIWLSKFGMQLSRTSPQPPTNGHATI
jgi:hypothetical protein